MRVINPDSSDVFNPSTPSILLGHYAESAGMHYVSLTPRSGSTLNGVISSRLLPTSCAPSAPSSPTSQASAPLVSSSPQPSLVTFASPTSISEASASQMTSSQSSDLPTSTSLSQTYVPPSTSSLQSPSPGPRTTFNRQRDSSLPYTGKQFFIFLFYVLLVTEY